MTTRNGQEPPLKIERVSAKIATLERRLEWLDERIARYAPDRDTGPRLNYDRAEREALYAAVRALKLLRAQLEPETDPVLALDELVFATKLLLSDASAHGYTPPRDLGLRVIEAFRRAEKLLSEVG
jgi:hypothetical protein